MNTFQSKLTQFKVKASNSGIHARATLLNTYAVLWHKLQVLVTPPHFLKLIVDMCCEFIWGKQKHWVKKAFLFAPKSQGGLGILHPEVQLKTLRLRFTIKSLLAQEHYFLPNMHSSIIKVFSNEVQSLSSFYKNLCPILKDFQVIAINVNGTDQDKLLISEVLFSATEIRALTSCGFTSVSTLGNTQTETLIAQARGDMSPPTILMVGTSNAFVPPTSFVNSKQICWTMNMNWT